MSNLEVRNFNGLNIEFKQENGMVYANATQMAKAKGKRLNVTDWLNGKETKAYMKALLSRMNTRDVEISTSDLVKVEHGNGTWIHEKMILNFARKVSPEFAVWCDEQLETLFRDGSVSILEDFEVPQTFADALMLAGRLEQKRVELEAQARIDRPKADFFDDVMDSTTAMTTTSIAKSIGMSASKLNKILHNLGVQYKVDGQWVLYAKYENLGYTKDNVTIVDGKSYHHTKWTEKGKYFIITLLQNKGIIKL